MSDNALINKYRPRNWDLLIGHEDVVEALQRNLNSDTCSHAFLLTGQSGTGKTTIARIIGRHLKAEIQETDAATNSGVEAMRSLMEISSYMPMGTVTKRMLIIDEAHSLSRSAWNSILKILEEPPDHLFIALCTTELEKVPETIQTRAYPIVLKPVKYDDLYDLLSFVAEQEGWTVNKDVMQAVVTAGTGQPRKALNILQATHASRSAEEVKRVINIMGDEDAYRHLARLLLEKAQWDRVQSVLARCDLDQVEQGIIVMGRYLTTVMLAENVTKDKAHEAWTLLDALVFPAFSWDKRAVFIAAIGRMLWS